MNTAVKSALLLTVGAFATYGGFVRAQDNAGQAGATQDSSSQSSQAGLNMQDKMFIKAAAQSNINEIKTSQEALKKATKPALKQYGQQMITEHEQAHGELKQIAQSKGATLPADTNEPNKAAFAKLTKLSGQKFNTEYIKIQQDGHEATLAAFKAEIADGQDPDVKAFATKYLPHIQNHLDEIKAIKKNGKMPKMSSMSGMSSNASSSAGSSTGAGTGGM